MFYYKAKVSDGSFMSALHCLNGIVFESVYMQSVEFMLHLLTDITIESSLFCHQLSHALAVNCLVIKALGDIARY